MSEIGLGRYTPDFDVLRSKEEWDKETRDVVMSRTSTPPPALTLRQHEVDTLTAIASVLLGDNRTSILQFVMDHFDKKMRSNIGESQRKRGIPPFPLLIHKGIDTFNELSVSVHGQEFSALDTQTRWNFISSLISNPVPFEIAELHIQSKDFLSSIHTEAVNAYFSHPIVWSEIGYAGPAYPRGYVRIERGLLDPWEAKSRYENN